MKIMWPFAVLALFLCFGYSLMHLLRTPNLAGSKLYRLDSETFELGERPVGDTVDHTFMVSNPFDHPIRILIFRPDCSCTVVLQYPSEGDRTSKWQCLCQYTWDLLPHKRDPAC